MSYLKKYNEYNNEISNMLDKSRKFIHNLIWEFEIEYLMYFCDLYDEKGNIVGNVDSINSRIDEFGEKTVILEYFYYRKSYYKEMNDVQDEVLLQIYDNFSDEFKRPIDLLNASLNSNNFVGVMNILKKNKDLDIDTEPLENIIEECSMEGESNSDYHTPGLQTWLWNYRDGKFRDVMAKYPKGLSKEMKDIKELDWAFDADELGLI